MRKPACLRRSSSGWSPKGVLTRRSRGSRKSSSNIDEEWIKIPRVRARGEELYIEGREQIEEHRRDHLLLLETGMSTPFSEALADTSHARRGRSMSLEPMISTLRISESRGRRRSQRYRESSQSPWRGRERERRSSRARQSSRYYNEDEYLEQRYSGHYRPHEQSLEGVPVILTNRSTPRASDRVGYVVHADPHRPRRERPTPVIHTTTSHHLTYRSPSPDSYRERSASPVIIVEPPTSRRQRRRQRSRHFTHRNPSSDASPPYVYGGGNPVAYQSGVPTGGLLAWETAAQPRYAVPPASAGLGGGGQRLPDWRDETAAQSRRPHWAHSVQPGLIPVPGASGVYSHAPVVGPVVGGGAFYGGR